MMTLQLTRWVPLIREAPMLRKPVIVGVGASFVTYALSLAFLVAGGVVPLGASGVQLVMLLIRPGPIILASMVGSTIAGYYDADGTDVCAVNGFSSSLAFTAILAIFGITVSVLFAPGLPTTEPTQATVRVAAIGALLVVIIGVVLFMGAVGAIAGAAGGAAAMPKERTRTSRKPRDSGAPRSPCWWHKR